MLPILNLIPRWVYAAAIAMLAATSCKLKWENGQLSIEIEKGKTHVATLETAIARSAQQVAAHNAAMESRARKAEQDRDLRLRQAAAASAALQSEHDRLRAAVASYTAQRVTAKDTLAPGLDAADPIPDLFVQCTERYADLARKADGHVIDIQALTEAWPK